MVEESKNNHNNSSNSICYRTLSIEKHFDEIGYNTTSSAKFGKIDSLLHHHDTDDNYEEKREEIENLYGYEDASPTTASSSTAATKMPRRSSLSDSSSKSRQRRRSTIGYRGEMELVLPTGKKTVRRSSIGFKEEDEEQQQQPTTTSTTGTTGGDFDCNNDDRDYDPGQLWFQREEYDHINEDVCRIIVASKRSKAHFEEKIEEGLCTRGLEPVLYGNNNNTREQREQAKACVLEEYAVQKSRNEYNDDVIRDIYSFFAIDSQIEANDRASNDQSEIENYLKITRKLHKNQNRRCVGSRRMSC